MTPPGGAPSAAELLRRIEEIVSAIERLQNRMEISSAAAAEFRTEYEKRHAEARAEIQAVSARLAAHEEDAREKFQRWQALELEIRALAKITDSLAFSNKLISWFAGIVGGAVVLWIVSQLLNVL